MKETGKVAIGQLIMNGREHLVGIKPHGEGLMLVILRYADEVRATEPYFEGISAQPKADAVALAGQADQRHVRPVPARQNA
jgi:DNA end-binding protein Ku